MLALRGKSSGTGKAVTKELQVAETQLMLRIANPIPELDRPLQQQGRYWTRNRGQGSKRIDSKGKAHAPYEFGVKVSVATTLHRSKGGQFVLHAKALREILTMGIRWPP